MRALVFILVLAVIVLGPARPFIFSNLRFFVPAVFGAVLGFWWVSFFLSASSRPEPLAPLLRLLGAGIGFFGVGSTVKVWADRTFGPRQ